MKNTTYFLILFYVSVHIVNAQEIFRSINESLLPRGNDFVSWEKPQQYSKTYYTDAQNGKDTNDGTASKPFKTISKAAEVLQAGERVIIKAGVYRENIIPARGGESPEKMITYQAEEGKEVIIKGSIELPQKGWDKVTAWQYSTNRSLFDSSSNTLPEIFRYKLDGSWFGGYNPFGMTNVQHDREWLQYQKVKMKSHFARRGMVFLNGRQIEQVEKPTELAEKDSGAFWIEHNGMTLHVRFPNGKTYKDYVIEITNKEQVFAPQEYGLGYIKLKGIKFMHSGNGFPVPQRGMVSTTRGHHWIIEDCVIEGANGTGLDMGTEMWHTVKPATFGYHIVRRNIIRNIGLCGFAASDAIGYLVEDNLIENVGWQDAEHGFEAAGIKFHTAQNTLIRRNVFRNIKHASGLWLDYQSNVNVRVTKNVFSNIITARGGIYVEAGHYYCHIDHNIFHKIFSQYWISGDYGAGGNALYTDGSDSIHFYNNFVFDIENSGYGCYLNAERIVGMRGGITRYHNIKNNLFLQCKKQAVELPNAYHELENNIYSEMPAGYLKMKYPEPALLLDLATWKQLYHWDKNSIYTKGFTAVLDTEKLTLSIQYVGKNELPKEVSPFNTLNFSTISIDTRKINTVK